MTPEQRAKDAAQVIYPATNIGWNDAVDVATAALTPAEARIAELEATLEGAERFVLEQRCERGTPWDRACVAIAARVQEYSRAALNNQEKQP